METPKFHHGVVEFRGNVTKCMWIEVNSNEPQQAYFWSTHDGAELDLLMIHGQARVGVEFKYADAPTVTRSMHTALQDLKLDRLYVVYPGQRRFPLSEQIEAVPLKALLA